MSLNLEKLENIKRKGSRIIARCPACAEDGHDNKGDHLFIDEHGRFTCVVYPSDNGRLHRKRIFRLVGDKIRNKKACSSPQIKIIKVKKVNRNNGNVIKSNILGRLGRVNQTLKNKIKIINNINIIRTLETPSQTSQT